MYARRLVLMVVLPAAVIAATGYLAFRGAPSGGSDAARARALLRKLADPDPDIRRDAESGLRALGPRAETPLREAAASPDPELAERAARLLREVAPAPAVAAAAGPAETPRAGENRPLELTLHCDEPFLRAGGPVRVYVRLQNAGPQPVILARQRPLRYASFAAFEVEAEGGKVVRHPSEPAHLPVTDGPPEWVAVAPGTTLDLYAGQGDGRTEVELPARNGLYRIRLIYEASEGSEYARLVDGGSEGVPLPRGRLVSNVLLVRVPE